MWFIRLSVTKKPTKGGGGGAAARKSGKAAKDPNKPKRPASAFFVFMYFSTLYSCSL
jgi:hypothetical protein